MLILDFNKIIDLIINSTKEKFIFNGELKITTCERRKTSVALGFEYSEDAIQVKVTIYFDMYDVNKAKISGFNARIIHTDNWNEFSSFEAHSLVDLEESLRTIFQNVVFFLADLEEVL